MATTPSPIDNTVSLFDQFYNINMLVPADQYELVLSYFKSISATDQIAQNFTTFLFIISNNTKIEAQDLLQQLKGLDGIQIDAVMAYYMNSVKTKTALYGVANELRPNPFAERNIVQ